MTALETSRVRSCAACLPVLAAAALGAVPTPRAHAQSIANIGVPVGGSMSGASAVSGDGRAVAATVDMSAAYRWTSGGFGGLGSLPGMAAATADDISADGRAIAGTAFLVDPEETLRAYRWTAADGMVSLGVLAGGIASAGNGISGDGRVVTGASYDADFNPTAFRWTSAGGMQSLGLLAGGSTSEGRRVSHDGGTIVGVADTAEGTRAFAWTEAGGMTNLGLLSAEDAWSSAFGVSADGSVVAGFSGSNAVFWNHGLARNLGALPAADAAIAFTVSADGSLVGGYSFFGRDARATLWSESMGLVDLNTYLPTLGINLTGWVLQYTRDVSADGKTIVGEGTFNGEFRGWVVTIPAPGSAVLLGMGGLLIGRRRR